MWRKNEIVSDLWRIVVGKICPPYSSFSFVLLLLSSEKHDHLHLIVLSVCHICVRNRFELVVEDQCQKSFTQLFRSFAWWTSTWLSKQINLFLVFHSDEKYFPSDDSSSRFLLFCSPAKLYRTQFGWQMIEAILSFGWMRERSRVCQADCQDCHRQNETMRSVL